MKNDENHRIVCLTLEQVELISLEFGRIAEHSDDDSYRPLAQQIVDAADNCIDRSVCGRVRFLSLKTNALKNGQKG